MQLFFLALESSFYNKTKYVYKRYFKDNNFFVDDLRNTLYNVAVQIDNAIICLKTSELKKKFSLRNWLKRFDVAKVHNKLSSRARDRRQPIRIDKSETILKHFYQKKVNNFTVFVFLWISARFDNFIYL